MFIEVEVPSSGLSIEKEKELVNLDLVTGIKRTYLGKSALNGSHGTIFKLGKNGGQLISVEDYDVIKKRIKQEAQKQTSVISRFELMEME